MNNLIYKSLKIVIGVTFAIFIAQIVGLTYSATAGVITMLSILDTKKQTYIVGLKRIIAALIALLIASVLFQFGGHNLITLGLFLLVYIPLLTVLNATEGLSVSTVLVTHIYTFGALGWSVLLNEMYLLILGVFVAWGLNLHMPNIEQEIRNIQLETESLIKTVLHKMKLQLLNQCSIEENKDTITKLNQTIKIGLDKAFEYNNNYFLKDNSYFIKYFEMRKQQYNVLVHMEKDFETIFITTHEAKLLSDFTELLANEFNERNTGSSDLLRINELKTYYKERELPKTREEFENSATLYQYLTDLTYFIEIKIRFMENLGDVLYCNINNTKN